MSHKSPAQPMEDDAKETVTLMVRHRLPWLVIGLIGGISATMLASQYGELLEKNIHLSFFIPVIVYMADAVGHQSESVFVRNLGRKKVNFWVYLAKEFTLGAVIGALFGLVTGIFAYAWFDNLATAQTVGYSMFFTMSIAPVVALVIPEILWKEHADPAIGSGPFATVVQDLLSLLIYFSIASFFIFK